MKKTKEQYELEIESLSNQVKELKKKLNKKEDETTPSDAPTECKDLNLSAVTAIPFNHPDLGEVFKLVTIDFNLDGDTRVTVHSDHEPNRHLIYQAWIRTNTLHALPNNGVK